MGGRSERISLPVYLDGRHGDGVIGFMADRTVVDVK